jgi:hypothetical protein
MPKKYGAILHMGTAQYYYEFQQVRLIVRDYTSFHVIVMNPFVLIPAWDYGMRLGRSGVLLCNDFDVWLAYNPVIPAFSHQGRRGLVTLFDRFRFG